MNTKNFYRKLVLLITAIVLTPNICYTKVKDSFTLYPAPLVLLDNYFSHHVFIAEKTTHELHVFQNNNGTPKHIKTYQMVSGKSSGNKQYQGDYRTPEGIYKILDFIPRKKLLQKYGQSGEIYGVGSFVMNYPNPIDRSDRKTGGGIWLHSTNDETRIEKGQDSRGCIVTANDNLKEISKYIELNKTNIIIVQDLNFIKKNTWDSQKKTLKLFVSKWIDNWRQKNYKEYIKSYHSNYSDPIRGSFKRFASHKKAVFSNRDIPKITPHNLSILQFNDYALVTFTQEYRSSTINDVGIKNLYLKQNEFYEWKIISETWSNSSVDLDVSSNFNFEPSMRFFSQQAKNSTKPEDLTNNDI